MLNRMLNGILVPLITPFDDAGAVALSALERLAHQVLDDGAAGLVALGTTGEPGSLDPGERQAVVDVAARVSRERGTTLLVGAGITPPDGAIELSLVPPFVRPGEEGVVAHFAAGAGPRVIYHVPHRTGQDLSTATIRRLAAIPGVLGMKYATGAVDASTVALLADPPPGFALLGGDDALISPMLALGADGGILASAHVATSSFVELFETWRAGDVKAARTLGARLAEVSAALFAEPNPTVIKAVLHAQGRIPTAAVRLPLLPAGPLTSADAYRLVNR
ncbi:4-hydroxy-tetrahydrodipicolinate synthase 2 [Actinoplanes campanulatus]|nr:4-hydroxy-tetrahydrodipicolinate synthase 2 [Actinoplanes campanulatus]GID35829.1 4-hydroxy-tetrahydrodipicolinate synthase 2 [Actinoplanes campanulatus]